jgi:hypothetical protein
MGNTRHLWSQKQTELREISDIETSGFRGASRDVPPAQVAGRRVIADEE